MENNDAATKDTAPAKTGTDKAGEGMRDNELEMLAEKGKNALILLVEDDPDQVHFAIRALKDNRIGNNVIVAQDGQEALDWVFGKGKYQGRDTNILPEIILLDLKLPKVGGLEVLKALKEDPHTAKIPVIILTTSDEERDINRGYELGVNSYLTKPVAKEGFTEAARRIGVYWLLVNKSPNRKG